MAEAKESKKRTFLTSLAEVIGTRFPDLRKKLRLAGMDGTPTEFLEKVVYSTLLISGGLILLVYAYLYFLDVFGQALAKDMSMFIAMIVAPLLGIPLIIFPYLMLYPDAMKIRRQKELDYEIVFAGRHIVIALKSGMPLFDTFVGTSRGYGAVSKEFAKIVDKIVLGVPMTQSIREVVQYNPSKYFTRMLMQIANALSSGADVGDSLESVLDHIRGAAHSIEGVQPEADSHSDVLHGVRHNSAVTGDSACDRGLLGHKRREHRVLLRDTGDYAVRDRAGAVPVPGIHRELEAQISDIGDGHDDREFVRERWKAFLHQG
jgi:hypothetical protein